VEYRILGPLEVVDEGEPARKALTRNGLDPIATADGGYRFEVDADELDLARLHQLLATAHERAASAELEAAAELLRG
jgi:hypothetical protein